MHDKIIDIDNVIKKYPNIKLAFNTMKIPKHTEYCDDKCIDFYIITYKDKKFQKIGISDKNDNCIVSIYLELCIYESIVKYSIINNDSLKFIIIKSNISFSIKFIDIDTGNLLNPKLWLGAPKYNNESYRNYINLYNSEWKIIYNVAKDTLAIMVEDLESIYYKIIFVNISYYNTYYINNDNNIIFNVINSEEISVDNNVSITKKNDIITIIDVDDSKYKRIYLEKEDELLRIINKTNIKENQLNEYITNIYNLEPDIEFNSPGDFYKVNIINTKILDVVYVIDIDDNNILLIVLYPHTDSIIIPQFSSKSKKLDDSKYIVIKKEIKDDIIIINTEEYFTKEFVFSDKTLKNETIITDMAISKNGYYLTLLGKVLNRIPYMSTFKIDWDKTILKSIKSSTSHRDTCMIKWKNNKLMVYDENYEYNKIKDTYNFNKSKELLDK